MYFSLLYLHSCCFSGQTYRVKRNTRVQSSISARSQINEQSPLIIVITISIKIIVMMIFCHNRAALCSTFTSVSVDISWLFFTCHRNLLIMWHFKHLVRKVEWQFFNQLIEFQLQLSFTSFQCSCDAAAASLLESLFMKSLKSEHGCSVNHTVISRRDQVCSCFVYLWCFPCSAACWQVSSLTNHSLCLLSARCDYLLSASGEACSRCFIFCIQTLMLMIWQETHCRTLHAAAVLISRCVGSLQMML